MAKVVAIDAGTTGVRALVVDEHGPGHRRRLPGADPALPAPGLGRARPERDLGRRPRHPGRGGSPPGRGRATPWPPSASPTSARPSSPSTARTGQPLHRAIVWQDRRTAADLRRARRGRPPPAGARHDRPRPRPVLQRHQGGLAPPPRRPRRSSPTTPTSRSAPSTPGCSGTSPAARAGAPTPPTPPTPAAPSSSIPARWPGPPSCATSSACRAHTLAEVRPSAGTLRHRRARATSAPVLVGPRRRPGLGVLGDQQAALFGQACFEAGHGQGHLRHRQLRAGQRRPATPAGARRPDRQRGLGPRRRMPARSRARSPTPLEGSTFVSGAAIQWLRDGLGIIDDAAEIGPLAASVPDSGGVTFVPALTGLGSPWWDPEARGIVTGLTRGAGRAQLARACVEAMAFQVRDMTDAMSGVLAGERRRLGPPTLRAAGGRGRRRHGPPPRAAGGAEPHARVPAPRRSSPPRSAPPPLAGLAEGCGPRSTSWPVCGRPKPSSNLSSRSS